MRTLTDFGSLRVLPKNPRHVTGDGDDGDTTILHKAIAMAHGINLYNKRTQELSMRRYNDARNALRWAIGIACVGIVILATKYVGALAWIERTLR
jgi:hypothetical protein